MSRLPELGPALGRLCSPTADAVSETALDDVRLELATHILELAGKARHSATDNAGAVVTALQGKAWIPHWEHAVKQATERTLAAIDRAFDSAAAESRYPRRKRAALTITPDERAAIHARLGSGAAPFFDALDRMDALGSPASASNVSSPVAREAWWRSVESAARRLESAWLSLEDAARRERTGWAREVESVRAWRRPSWPLWSITAAAMAAALYLGLILGGYLPVPGVLRPLAEFWWRQVPWV